MKNLHCLFAVVILLGTVGCQRDNNSVPSHCTNNVKDANETGVDCGGDCSACTALTGYFFKFTLAGVSYEYKTDIIQYGASWNNEFGGYVPTSNLDKSGGIKFYLSDTATSTRINQLVGDSIFFDSGVYPYAEITQGPGGFQPYNRSQQSSDHKYFVHVSSINFLGRDTGLFDLDIYAVKGTFKARIENGNSGADMGETTGGEFFLQCSAYHY